MPENGAGEATTNGSGDALRSALEQHKGLLVPAALSVAGAFAAVKGPSIARGLAGGVEDKVDSTAEQAGAKAVEGAKKSLGKGGGGGKKTRRLPIQRWTDVAVPVEQAYEAWTKFEQFPKFMHRVLSVEQKEDDKISWQEKIWFSRRQWEGQITERRKNDRIVWKTKSGMSHRGIVSFHPLGDRLTRVMVEMEFEPNGLIEKMGSGLRFVKRAVQADLARFKAYVELQDVKGIDYRSGDAAEDEESDNGQEGGASPSRPRASKPKPRSSSTKSATARRSSARRTTSSASGARKRKS